MEGKGNVAGWKGLAGSAQVHVELEVRMKMRSEWGERWRGMRIVRNWKCVEGGNVLKEG